MSHLSRRSVLGIAAAATVAPLAVALPARAVTRHPLDNWTYIDQSWPRSSYWNVALPAPVGAEYLGVSVFRSLFRVPIRALAGATIASAAFTIKLTHTPSTRPYPVQLFAVRDLDPSQEATWANSSDAKTWLTHLDTVSATSYTEPPQPVLRFAAAAVRERVQAAAAARAPYVSFGLRAPDEYDMYYGKRFDASTTALEITTA